MSFLKNEMVNFLERLEMSILRNRTQESFTIVNQTITKDKELGITERGLLITILSLPDNWEFTIAGLQQILPDGKEKISNSLKKLEEAGYIERRQTKVNGKYGSNEIEVYQERTQCDEEAEKPSAENPSTETPSADSDAQYNTNKLNNSKVNTNNVCATRNESGITSEQRDELIRKYSARLVDDTIRRASTYKKIKVTFDLIDQWCGERIERNKTNQFTRGQYDDYIRQDYDIAEIERRLLAK